MKKIFTISICFLFGTQFLLAQKSLKFEIKEKKNDVIYLSLNSKNELEYFVDNKGNISDSKKNASGKDNQINLYLKWINPLRYKLSWKDSTLTDERDKAITDFVSLLVGQFGTSVSNLNVPNGKLSDGKNAKDSTEIKGINFADKDLLLLLIHLRSNQNYLDKDKGEIFMLNKFFESLKALDDLVSKDVSVQATEIYSTLFNFKDTSDYYHAENGFKKQSDKLKEIEKELADIEKGRKEISDKLKAISIGNELLKSYINAVLTSYLEKSLTKLNNDKKIIEKLKPILETVKASTENESVKHKGYYKIRSMEFDNGKKIETVLTITEYEFKKETSDFSKKSDILSQTFEFQKYDIFDVSVSTGIFYGNTTLKGFGVANDGTNFTVTEDDINKNTAVAAVFLNFNFKTSRYFSPLLQLGIDPTKKRPFMLLGAGFSIPVATIAISGGPIWTWNQSLDNLSVGQTITSTTDLDKDIKYKFEVVPKGWYLGIQYNFGIK